MKYKIGIPLFILAAGAGILSYKYIKEDVTDSNARKALILSTVVGVMEEAHYSPRPLDDSFSNRVFNKWIETADFEKKFFTKKDLNQLEKYRYDLDDEIKSMSFNAFEEFDQLYMERLNQVEGYFKELIKADYTKFDSQEEIALNRDKIDFAKDDKELKERWRKYIKYRVLAKYMEMKKVQDDEVKRRDTLTVKDTSQFIVKSIEALKLSAKGKVDTNMQKFFTKVRKNNDNDRFALYVNAISLSHDPHSDYMPPREKKNFEVQMSGEFFGIGAQLKKEDDKVKIASIVPGSPSWKQGDLKANDEILKVAQGNAEPEDIQGYDLEDVVQKIRGEKGTEVRLTVKSMDGAIKVIPIIRGKVALEEIFAKSAIIKRDNQKFGYIYLSEFYSNFSSADGRKSSEDIAKEVEKLKGENVDGIILDLRFNGGGSLTDVVDMNGLFVGNGPVVQVKTSEARPTILKSRNSISYNGPFVIMVNQYSASASEILAAAMQDYGRAVIVGNSTFGKGTVQKQIPLDDIIDPIVKLKMANNKEPEIGSLKLTIQKFYRVNGGSTQLKGVVPDIVIPDVYSQIQVGERKDKAALPYDQINAVQLPELLGDPSQYKYWAKNLDINLLKAKSESRIAKSKSFELVKENALRLKKLDQENIVSLNEVKFKKEQDANIALSKKIEDLDKIVTLLDIENLAVDATRLQADTAANERNKNWIKLLKKDITLSETVNIMEDMRK